MREVGRGVLDHSIQPSFNPIRSHLPFLTPIMSHLKKTFFLSVHYSSPKAPTKLFTLSLFQSKHTESSLSLCQH